MHRWIWLPARSATAVRAVALAAVVFAAGFEVSFQAHAAEQSDEPYALEPVLVTASKRRENVQDVPASIWVASAESLEKSFARDFDDLARLVPSLTITKTTQPANNSINIRGIGTYAFSIATKPSVSVIVDDVPQAFQAQAFMALADIEQIEVLRGPQSTLFGTSATAGVVNITTRSPTTTFSAGARSIATNDGEQRVSGYLSGPLAENLRFRIHAGSVEYRGNLRNLYTGNWVNGHDDLAVQAKILWEPATDWSVSLAYRWNDTRGTCCTSAMQYLDADVSFGRFQGYSANQVAVLAGVIPNPENRHISADIDPQADARDRGTTLRIERAWGARSVAWITGVNRYDLDDLQDTDGTSFDWGPDGAGVPGAIEGGSANGGSFLIDSISSELRLTSAPAGRLRYLAALHVSRIESARSFVRGSNELTQYGSLAAVPPTTSSYSTYSAQALAENLALFGTASFDVTPRLGLEAGLRLNHERLEYSLLDRLNQVSFGVPDCSSQTPSGLLAPTCESFDSLTGKVALTYRLTPSLMVFGGYDRGYKGAAYDLTSTYTSRSPVTAPGPTQGFPIGDAVASKQPIAAETVDAFQFGVKARLLERYSVGFTAYDATFHNYQAQSRDELTRQNILNSVERVRTRGLEGELTATPRPWLALNAVAAYNLATADEFPRASCYASQTAALGCVGGEQDLSGTPLSNAPRWTLGLNAGITLPIDDGNVIIDAGFHWRSKVLYSLLRDPRSLQGAYGTLNLGVGLERRHWAFKAFVVNALDKTFALSKSRDGNWNINPYGASAGAITDAVKWAPGRDSSRYFGVEIDLRR